MNGRPGGDRWARALGGHEFSVGRLAGCRSPFTESTLTPLDLSQPEVVCTILKIQNHSWKTRLNPPHPKHTTKSTATRRPLPPRDGMRRNTSHALAHTRPLPYSSGPLVRNSSLGLVLIPYRASQFQYNFL